MMDATCRCERYAPNPNDPSTVIVKRDPECPQHGDGPAYARQSLEHLRTETETLLSIITAPQPLRDALIDLRRMLQTMLREYCHAKDDDDHASAESESR